MASVLRILRHTDLLEGQPVLVAYKQRCEAGPAFRKALAETMDPDLDWGTDPEDDE